MHDQPETIGRYRITGTLGTGAMGIVYRAHDPDIDRQVALKVIRKELLAGEDGKFYLDRFRHEVQAAGRCMHPNIIALYDYGMHEDAPYFVMEYVDGQAVDDVLVGGLGTQVGSDIILQLLDALSFAHGMGIVHRDIKPANLLMTSGHRVKVMDFGISRIVSRSLTRLGLVMGTPGYMSPEQFRGDPTDARTDIFAVGAVLYEVIRGARPITGRSFEEVMARVVEPAPLKLLPADDVLTEPMRAVVAKALAKAPDDRFQSAVEMSDAIRAALGAPIPTRPAGADAKTIVRAGRDPAATDTLGDEVDPRLAKAKSALTVYLGPIAGALVRRHARQTTSFQTLLHLLAESIDEPGARADFLRRANEPAAGAAAPPRGASTPPTNKAALSPIDDPLAIEKALARHVGPIAKLLVKRALADGAGPLRPRLAHHIEDEAARAAFLQGRD